MTHSELVEIGYNWLMKEARCSFAFKELRCYTKERPDLIGFQAATGDSVLIECKTSRADFLKDNQKYFRKFSQAGMGNYRFYLCPEGLLGSSDIQARCSSWGLLWALKNGNAEMIEGPSGNVWTKSNFNHYHRIGNWEAERGMLISALRRVQKKCDIHDFL